MENIYDRDCWQATNIKRPGGLALTKALLQLSGSHLPEEASILDICCGSGETVLYLRACGFDAMGIDKSQLNCQKARDKGLDILCADALQAQCAEASFDAIICECALSQFHTCIEEIAFELQRILKPKGVILLSDIFSRNPQDVLSQDWLEQALSAFTLISFVDKGAELKKFLLEHLWRTGENLSMAEHDCSTISPKEISYYIAVFQKI